MDPLSRLLAAEEIRYTKASYWYFLDTKDWDALLSVFTHDVIFDLREEAAFSAGKQLGPLPSVESAIASGDPAVTVGGQALVSLMSVALNSWKTVHQGHAPIIEIESRDEGRAIWPLFDYIDDGARSLKGYGHYHEKYRRQDDGRWLISFMRITRLRADGEYPHSGRETGGE